MGAWCHVPGPPDLASGHQRKFPGGGDNFHRYERRVDTVWLWPGKPGSPSITRMLLSWGTARPKVLAALRSHSCIAHGGKTVSRENMLCDYVTVCLCLYTDVPKTAFFKRNKANWWDINTSSCTGPNRKKKDHLSFLFHGLIFQSQRPSDYLLHPQHHSSLFWVLDGKIGKARA